MFYLGIDGGGTRSRLAAADGSGNICGRYEGATTNIASNTGEIVKRNIEALIAQFMREKEVSHAACAGICIGSAGVDTPEYVMQMEQIIREQGFTCPVQAVNDGELLLWAELKDEEGVALVSGTGSVAFGKDKAGRVKRCGGWGHLTDDKGSGYWIGKEVVSRAFMAYDGREQETVLQGELLAQFHKENLPDILNDLYEEGFRKEHMAGLAVLAARGAQRGDAVCVKILEEAAEDLLKMAEALIRRLDLGADCNLIWSGGSLLNNVYLKQCFTEKAYQKWPAIRVTQTVQEPVIGAVYLAEQGGKL